MQNEIYDEKNGLTYMLCGDYYLPELALTDIEPTYGKYGMLGICKRMWSNDNNWDGIWCNTRLCPIFGKKFRDIGCKTVEYDK